MATKAQLKLARDLFDRFFRDAEGRTDAQLDLVYTLEDLGVPYERAEESIEWLQSRGVIKLFGDTAYLTEVALRVAAEDLDLGDLPKHEQEWGGPGSSALDSAQLGHTGSLPPDNLRRPPFPRLTYLDEAGKAHIFELGRNATLGRGEEATLTLPDKRASKKHCEVMFAGDHYRVRDLGSANGTMVNAEYVEEQPLQHLDVLLVGRTEVLYECPEVILEPRDPDAKPKLKVPPMAPPDHPMVPPPAQTGPHTPPPLHRPPPLQQQPPPLTGAREAPIEAPSRRPEMTLNSEAVTEYGAPPRFDAGHELPAFETEDVEAPTPPPSNMRARVDQALAQNQVRIVKGEPSRPPSLSRGSPGHVEFSQPELTEESRSNGLFDDDQTETSSAGDLFDPDASAHATQESMLFSNLPPSESVDLFDTAPSANEPDALSEDVDLFNDTGDVRARGGEFANEDLFTGPGRAMRNERAEAIAQRGGARYGGGNPGEFLGGLPSQIPDAAPEPLIEPLARAPSMGGAFLDHSRLPRIQSGDLLDIPDAPISLEEEVAPESSNFRDVLAALRRKTELAALPDKDDVLSAIDLLEHHPYIRNALAQLEH